MKTIFHVSNPFIVRVLLLTHCGYQAQLLLHSHQPPMVLARCVLANC